MSFWFPLTIQHGDPYLRMFQPTQKAQKQQTHQATPPPKQGAAESAPRASSASRSARSSEAGWPPRRAGGTWSPTPSRTPWPRWARSPGKKSLKGPRKRAPNPVAPTVPVRAPGLPKEIGGVAQFVGGNWSFWGASNQKGSGNRHFRSVILLFFLMKGGSCILRHTHMGA